MPLSPSFSRRTAPGFTKFNRPTRGLSAGVPLTGGNPGGIIFEDPSGKSWYMWIDSGGAVKIIDAAWAEAAAGFAFDTNGNGYGVGFKQPSIAYTANGALAITPGIHWLNKAGSAAVMTLAAPPSSNDDGTIMIIMAQTAFAHTVTNAS